MVRRSPSGGASVTADAEQVYRVLVAVLYDVAYELAAAELARLREVTDR